MRELKKPILRFLLAAVALISAGCAAAPVALLPMAAPAMVSGASGGISYTFTNIATNVSNYPMEQVAEANLKALRKMGIEVMRVRKAEKQVKIKARTEGLYIYITVEYLTPVLTRLSVNARRGFIRKDKVTAFEIMLFTERFLHGAYPGWTELSSNEYGAHPLSALPS